MPSIAEIRTRALLSAAEAAKASAATALVAANAATDDAYAAIIAAVKAAGYTDFEVSSHVSVPARLRCWSPATGVSPPGRVSIGLQDLAAAYTAANIALKRRQNENDGLVYLISSANGILCQDTDFEAETTAADLSALQQMLASIQASVMDS